MRFGAYMAVPAYVQSTLCVAQLRYATEQQPLAVIPFTNLALAGPPLMMELEAGKVRVLLGGAPLVSATTDTNGWGTYTGPYGRTNALALIDHRFTLRDPLLAGAPTPVKNDAKLQKIKRHALRMLEGTDPKT